MLAIGIFMNAVAAFFIISAAALVLVILIQKGKGGGLSAAFGGGGAGGLLGSKTGDFLTWVTMVLVGVFLILAVILAKFYKPSVSEFGGAQPQLPTAPVSQPKAPAPQPKAPLAPSDDLGTEDSKTSEADLPGEG